MTRIRNTAQKDQVWQTRKVRICACVESELFSDLIGAPRAKVLCEAGHQRLATLYDLRGLASNPDGHLMARCLIKHTHSSTEPTSEVKMSTEGKPLNVSESKSVKISTGTIIKNGAPAFQFQEFWFAESNLVTKLCERRIIQRTIKTLDSHFVPI